MKSSRILNGLTRIFLMMMLMVSILFFIVNLVIDGYTVLYVQEIRFIYGGSLVAIILAAGLLFCFNRIKQWLLDHDTLMRLLFYSILFLLCLVISFHANAPRTDAALCFDFATNFKSLLDGTLSNISYLHRFPYNLSIVLIDYAFLSVFGEFALYALRILNAMMVLLTIWSFEQIIRLFKPTLNLWWLRLLFGLWAPVYFLCALVYGWLYGLGLISVAVYCYLRYIKTNSNLRLLIAAVLFALLALFFKLNYAIVLVAVLIAVSLTPNLKHKLFHCVAIVCVLYSGLSLPKWVGMIGFGFDPSEEMPITVYFVMTNYRNNEIEIGENLYLDGWVDGTHNAIYEMVAQTDTSNINRTLSEFARDSLQLQLTEAIRHPLDAFKFYAHKWISTWMVQDYGMFNEYNVNLTALNGLENSGVIIALLCAEVCSILSFFGFMIHSGYLALKKRRVSLFDLVFGITFLGFVAYYLLGEGQSRYVITAIMLLMPFSAVGLDDFVQMVEPSINNCKPKAILVVLVAVLLVIHFGLRISTIQIPLDTVVLPSTTQSISINSQGYGSALNNTKQISAINHVELIFTDEYSNRSFELIFYDPSGNAVSYNRYDGISAYSYTPIRLDVIPFDLNEDGYTIFIQPLDGLPMNVMVDQYSNIIVHLFGSRIRLMNIYLLPWIPSNNFPF